MNITNPILKEAYDNDWYFPWEPTEDVKALPQYRQAVNEGWAEWIENENDVEAIKQGYIYDLSRDMDGNPAYWFRGEWLLHDGTVVSVGDEADHIAYVGKGDVMMRFSETFLCHTKGEIAGTPYRFIPWMRKLCATVFGWVKRPTPDNAARNRRYQHVYVAIAKKNGKALAWNTVVPVPTLGGWKLHSELKVGDKVFDRRMETCEVVHVHEPTLADRRVVFGNGQCIVATAEHEWVVEVKEEDVWVEKTLETQDFDGYNYATHGPKYRIAHALADWGYVYIHRVERIAEGVQANCITVSSPDGTYLCGETMIPTHNSAVMSVVALYMLIADGTPKAYVYGCACDRNQASIVYDEAAHMVRGSPIIESEVTVIDSTKRLTHQRTGSYYRVLSADAHRNDGLDSSCTLVDEIHRHPNRKLYVVMKRAGQARPNPLLCVITTYGPSISDGSIWAEIHREAKAQLAGQRVKSIHNLVMVASAEPIQVVLTQEAKAGDTRLYVSRLQQPVDAGEIEFDLSQFAPITQDIAPSDDDSKIKVRVSEPAKRFQTYLDVEPLTDDIPIYSEATANQEWKTDHAIKRANPSVGVTFQLDRLRKEVEDAKTPEAEAETKQLNFNIVAGSGRKWLSSAAWLACGRAQVQPKSLIGRYCYGASDISFGNDLTAFALAFPNWDSADIRYDEVSNPRVDLLGWVWVPEERLEEREEMEEFAYRHHAKMNYLIDGYGPVRICRGKVIDFAQVAKDIVEICQFFEVRGIAYDPNYAQFVVPKLTAEGLTCIAHRQGAVSMSPPCKRFSTAVYKGWIAHGNNPVLDRAVEGAVLHPPDKAGNTYLSKGSSHTRIDLVVASVMAHGYCCDPPVPADGAWSGAPGSGMW